MSILVKYLVTSYLSDSSYASAKYEYKLIIIF
jgi:hypothetical protein